MDQVHASVMDRITTPRTGLVGGCRRTELGQATRDADGAMDVSLAVAAESDRPIDSQTCRPPALGKSAHACRAGTPTTSSRTSGRRHGAMVIDRSSSRVPSPARWPSTSPPAPAYVEQRCNATCVHELGRLQEAKQFRMRSHVRMCGRGFHLRSILRYRNQAFCRVCPKHSAKPEKHSC